MIAEPYSSPGAGHIPVLFDPGVHGDPGGNALVPTPPTNGTAGTGGTGGTGTPAGTNGTAGTVGTS